MQVWDFLKNSRICFFPKCLSGSGSNMHLLCWQARAEPPTQSQVHLHDHVHAAGNRVSTETQQRGAVATKLTLWFSDVLFLFIVFHLLTDTTTVSPLSCPAAFPPSCVCGCVCAPCRSVNKSGWAFMTTGH